MSICTNITAAVENMFLWHKSLTTKREGGVVYFEFKTGHPDMVGKG